MEYVRTDADVLAGVIRVRLGQQERRMRALPIAKARDWKDAVAAAGVSIIATPGNLEGFTGIARLAGDRILDLVLAYDQASGAPVLGTKADVEEIADDAQVYAIFRLLLDVSFPFVADVAKIVRALGLTPGDDVLSKPDQSGSQPSTAGPSDPDGDQPTSTDD